uniref:Uncharacterized protein n=1 Tax=viral metagenome TaxID=1070528 RepID=A0A6M3JGI6_9ZZZZ
MARQRKFKCGNRVKYVSRIYGDELFNPVWGGKYGKVGGTITYFCAESDTIIVHWDNRYKNDYCINDLELIHEQTQLNLFGGEK